MIRIVPIAAILLLLLTCATCADQQFSIVTPEWVAAHASDPSTLILDVRAEPSEYFTGHVPNAVNMADNTMRGPKDGLPVQYLPVTLQAELLKRAGVKDGQTIIVYSDGQNVLGATMVAYVLEKIGHPNVKLIDGGWSLYKTSQQASQQYPSYKPGMLSVKEQRIYVTLAEVTAAIGKPKIKLIDARPNKAYTGEVNIWMRNGHIPGAINIDWHSLIEADNAHKIKSMEQIQAIYDAKGVKKTDNIILYCGTSREASLEYAVMKHIMGFKNVRLYEGSWTEYCAHPELPIETGNP